MGAIQWSKVSRRPLASAGACDITTDFRLRACLLSRGSKLVLNGGPSSRLHAGSITQFRSLLSLQAASSNVFGDSEC